MRAEIETQVKAYVEDEAKRKKVMEMVDWLDKKGCLIMSVDNLAIRYLDRNMNKCSYPLTLIE